MVSSINASSSYAAQLMNSTRAPQKTNLTDSLTSKKTVQDVIDLYLKKYSESYDTNLESADSEDKKKMIKSLISEADKNGDEELSKEELSSIDISQDKDKSDFVQALMSQFDTLDKNKDGLLSIDEMKDVVLKKQFSQKEMEEMAKGLGSNADAQGTSKNNYSTLEGAILNHYKKENFDELSSSISISA